MKNPTLDAFIKKNKDNKSPTNSYISEPAFSELYVRMAGHVIEGALLYPVLDISRVTAKHPGRGAFTDLVKKVTEQGLPVYVECVVFERFRGKLLRMGFKRDPHVQEGLPCFYLLPENRG